MAITTINSNDNGATSLVKINDNFTDLDTTKADLASPTFTGTVTLPTGLTGILRSDSGVVSVQSTLVILESSSSTTHSLTTNGIQKVLVTAKGWIDCSTGITPSVDLKYNGVTKDTITMGASARIPFCLTYVETPANTTQNITLVASAGTIISPVITVIKT